MCKNRFPDLISAYYDIYEWRHAYIILKGDFPHEWEDIEDVLSRFKLYKSWITAGGGGKSKISSFFDSELAKKGWREKSFKVVIDVDGVSRKAPTHAVDCFKNRIALEIEWNNKDTFFDRDLNNFRLLFDLHAISVGVIITRCEELQAVFNELECGASYGNSTTHVGKLEPRIHGGGGGGCPLLIFGIRSELYDKDN